MKKIYFLALSVFMAGGIMAQSATTNTDRTALKKETKKENATNFTVGSKTSTSTENTNNNSKVGVDQTTTKKEVIQTGPTVKSNQANKPEVDLPGFPVMENTGDANADKVNYIAARDKWIRENQELYNNYINSKK